MLQSLTLRRGLWRHRILMPPILEKYIKSALQFWPFQYIVFWLTGHLASAPQVCKATDRWRGGKAPESRFSSLGRLKECDKTWYLTGWVRQSACDSAVPVDKEGGKQNQKKRENTSSTSISVAFPLCYSKFLSPCSLCKPCLFRLPINSSHKHLPWILAGN